jgi:hypothetical protein
VQKCGTIFLLFLERQATDAGKLEKVTKATLSASLVKIGHGAAANSSCGSAASARGSAPVRIKKLARDSTPATHQLGHTA